MSLLVVVDVDSTLISDEVIELLAEAAGQRERVAAITDRAMRGEIDFAASLAERVGTLAGLPSSVVDEVTARVRLTPGASELIAAVHDRGGRIAAVSGGFHDILDPLARRLGLDDWAANRLEIVRGQLTGRTTGPIIDARAKRDAVERWRADGNVRRVVAIGDGANDRDMLAAADLGIAFCAKPALRDVADVVISRQNLADAVCVLGG